MNGGVYCIRNNVTGDCYVGTTNRFRPRWLCHLGMLRKGKHFNPAMQAAFARDGENAFAFEILESLPDEADQFKVERRWILKLQPAYNAPLPAGRPNLKNREHWQRRKLTA